MRGEGKILKTYGIVYQVRGKQPETIECTKYSLQKYIEHFAQENAKVLCIVTHSLKKKEKPRDINKEEKLRYYNNQYSNYYKRYKNGKIDVVAYEEIKKKLKELKNVCKTREEYQVQFEAYKKSANSSSCVEYIKKKKSKFENRID